MITHKARYTEAEFYVTKDGNETLISYDTAKELGTILVANYMQPMPSYTEKIMNKYSDRFTGIGKMRNVQCKLHIDESVKPVAQPHRRLPFHIRKQTEKELKRLIDLDVIEPVGDDPTPWISPIRVVKKPKNPDEIRICVDMRAPNKAIQRERHITPTIDDIIADLNGAKVFTKLDLNAGYHQIELAPESRHMTVFSTHIGLFRYKNAHTRASDWITI